MNNPPKDRVCYLYFQSEEDKKNDRPYYVGEGHKMRPYQDRGSSESIRVIANKYKEYFDKSGLNQIIQAESITPSDKSLIKVVKKNLTKIDALIMEAELIKEYGRVGIDNPHHFKAGFRPATKYGRGSLKLVKSTPKTPAPWISDPKFSLINTERGLSGEVLKLLHGKLTLYSHNHTATHEGGMVHVKELLNICIYDLMSKQIDFTLDSMLSVYKLLKQAGYRKAAKQFNEKFKVNKSTLKKKKVKLSRKQKKREKERKEEERSMDLGNRGRYHKNIRRLSLRPVPSSITRTSESLFG